MICTSAICAAQFDISGLCKRVYPFNMIRTQLFLLMLEVELVEWIETNREDLHEFFGERSCWFWKYFWIICLSFLWLVDIEAHKCFCFRYEGLSDKFLSCPVQKILLLAGTDRLDRFATSIQSEKLYFHSLLLRGWLVLKPSSVNSVLFISDQLLSLCVSCTSM